MKLVTAPRLFLQLLAAASIGLFATETSYAAKECFDCHQKEKAEFSSRKNVHEPVKDAKCESCHKRHGFSNKLILVDNTNQLCYSCHAELKQKFSAGNVHSPVAEGVCWSCHDPHSSDKKALLRKGPEGADDPSSCLTCHKGDLAKSVGAKFPHEPFDKQDCVLCHDPHNSPNLRLLKADAITLCSSCHDLKEKKFVSAHEGKYIQYLGCADCHSGHSSNTKGLLSKNGHEPFQEGSCDACHSLPDSAGKVTFAEGVTPGNICSNCHSDQAGGPTRKFPHSAVEAENCNNCHSGHSSPYGMLLKREEKKVCGDCHGDIATDTTKSLHMPAATGLCGTCHEVHGSDNKSLVKKTDASLCLDCHTQFVVERDSAKTVHAGAADCLTCHSPHEAKTKQLLRQDTKDLCGSCHTIPQEALDANSTHSPYMERDCAACHLPHYSKTEHLVREDGNKLCLDCHPQTALQIKMPTAHSPAVEDCKTCHSPHFSAIDNLLKAPEKELCVTCHDSSSLKTDKAFVHTPVGSGDCTGCHNPHGSVEPKLLTGRAISLVVNGAKVMQPPTLTGKYADLCYTCHETLQEKFREGVQHAPVAEGKCDACHDAHGSDFVAHIKDQPAKLCATCHALDQALMAKHDNYDLTNANCIDCHNPHASKKPNLLRENSHPPFEEKSCDACHTKGADGKLQLAGAVNEICANCHDVVGKDMALPVKHAPFEGGDCVGCHNVHASDYKHLLKADGNTLCLNCHSDIKALKDQTVQHRPFESGSCLDCHKPHASEYPHLMTKPAKTFCLSCHTELKDQLGKGAVHSPVQTGECVACHLPHAGPNPSLLVTTKDQLCGKCHDLKSAKMTADHHSFDLTKADCQNCHAPHVGQKGVKGLLLPTTHPPFESRDCSQCHEETGDHKLLAPQPDLCLNCHQDFSPQMSKAVVHGAVKEGCTKCHGPHVGYGKNLQIKNGVSVCLTCHNGKGFTGSLKHKPAFENCENCHQPHSADYKYLLDTRDINSLCTKCHPDAQKTHMHPVGNGKIDPRTGGPLTCVSCHSPHSSDNTSLLLADKNRKLCVLCHSIDH